MCKLMCAKLSRIMIPLRKTKTTNIFSSDSTNYDAIHADHKWTAIVFGITAAVTFIQILNDRDANFIFADG